MGAGGVDRGCRGVAILGSRGKDVLALTGQIAQLMDNGSSGGTDLILVLDPGLNPTDFALYLRSNPDFARVDVPSRGRSASSIAEQLTRITAAKERRRVWYLDDQGVEAQANDDMLDCLRTNLVAIEERDFTTVRLFQFAPRDQAAGGSR